MTYETVYRHIKHPWLSKSKLQKYKACKYRYQLEEILGIKHKGDLRKANMGTIMHEVFDRFFDYVSFEDLMEYDWRRLTPTGNRMDINTGPVYRYFVDILTNLVPARIRTQSWVRRNIHGFAMLEEKHWHSVRGNFEDPNQVRRYWLCTSGHREHFYTYEKFKMTGTIDREIEDFSPDILLMSDYKTGDRIPKGVKEDVKNGIYSTKLPNKFVLEGNFYCMLKLLNNGYELNRHTDGKYYFFKYNKIQRTPRIDYQFIWTQSFDKYRPYYIARKKMSITSVRKIMELMDEIRNNKNWPKVANQYICGWCTNLNHECKHIKEKYDFIYYPDLNT